MIKDVIQNNQNTTANQKKLEELKKIFPSCFTSDGKFDIERFNEEIKDDITTTKEGYELKFLGKNYARLLASLDTQTVIKPDTEHNKKCENANSKNVYISGDNLDALKHLLKSYAGKIKCIYIDPPYNTGNDGFVYNDKFNFDENSLQTKLSIDAEHAKRIIDFTTKGSRSHSAWLTFMYPRLQLARDLLKDDGVIFISIDDNEQANLKLLCDDVFGAENLVYQLSVVNNLNGNDNSSGMVESQEYCLIYAKNKSNFQIGELCIEEEENEDWQVDQKGYWKEGRALKATGINAPREARKNLFFPIYINEETLEFTLDEKVGAGWYHLIPLTDGKEMSWYWSKQKFINEADEVIVKRTKDGYSLYKKQRPALGDLPSKRGKTTFYSSKYANANSNLEIKSLFNDVKIFDYPKAKQLIKDIIQLSNYSETKENIILDFFSGSATTAHAVMELNAESQNNCQYILVQLPENLDENLKKQPTSDSLKNAIDYCNKNNLPHTLDQIGMARIQKAAAKIASENPMLKDTMDLGFKHYTLCDVAQNTLDKIEKFNPNILVADNSIYNDFGLETVLQTYLIHDGYTFNAEVQIVELESYKAYWCKNHLYLIEPNFSDESLKSLFDKYNTQGNFNPQNIVVFGYNFNFTELENLKVNVKTLIDSSKNLKVAINVRY